MEKIILFVDADNISESYTQRIYEKALAFGDVYEAHCFGDFVRRKEKWEQAYYQYKMQLHYIPSMDKQKGKPDPNTSDIALTTVAMQKMYECPEVDAYILVTNDKDYIPLAKVVREKFHKKAVMFYTQQNDRAVLSYDEAVFLGDTTENDDAVAVGDGESENVVHAVTSDAVQDKAASAAKGTCDFDAFCTLSTLLREYCKDEEGILFAKLGPKLKDGGVNYGESLRKYLKEMFERYPVLREGYELDLGNGQDKIKRIAK